MEARVFGDSGMPKERRLMLETFTLKSAAEVYCYCMARSQKAQYHR